MNNLKELIKKAESSLDWDEITKDIKEETGDDLNLSGIDTHYHFKSWEALGAVIIEVAGKAFNQGWENAIDPINYDAFLKWYDEFIKEIKP